MTIQQAIWQTRREYLGTCRPELPVSFFNPATLTDTAQEFRTGFPGLVSYAVKANPDANVLRCLVAAGVNAFDVASPVEIDLVRSVAPLATLHYHNPVRSVNEVKHAVRNGVRSYSVDRPAELEKLLAHIPEGSEISVRLKLDLAGAAYDFGAKFGAEPDMCVSLLRRVQECGHQTSMTFHPGTQCTDPQTWAVYIAQCALIEKQSGCKLYRLNVGGGFPSHRGHEKPTLTPIFYTIKQAVLQYFPNNAPDLVCEPGRAMVADAFSLAICVKALSDNIIFSNDGLYGGLSEFRDTIGQVERYQAIQHQKSSNSKELQNYTVFGPTCDSLDQLPAPLCLPIDIAEGDYILFENMGAYTHAIATQFNGYGNTKYVTITNY